MKKGFINYGILFAAIGCLVMSSCDKKTTEVKTTTKNDMDSEAKTIENMLAAYKGEKTATAKYAAYAKKAEEEGFHAIATLYQAVSAAESVHAANHKIVIEDAGATVSIITPEFTVKSTKENLADDINGEAYEAKTMYPDFLETAEKAKNQIAYLSLSYAMKTEAKHQHFFEETLADMTKNTMNKLPTTYFVCPACGNTYAGAAPKHCDFSLTDGKKFMVFK
ncbi:MAG: rubrerythrin [Flavobacterium sp. BFFFF2]|nr:MAG: rubrerythrin [Flavobacterium sp. BFFFF2]